MSFQNLGLSDDVVHAVQSMYYMDPTPIQLQAFPIVLGGRDLIGASQTGTGKTAAFCLPLLTHLKARGKLRALILEPTRELALQVEAAIKDYTRFTNIRTTVVYGGVGYGQQTTELKRGTDIVVATPGRLLDFLEQKAIDLNFIKHLVLDEADRMLDMGFMPDVRKIIEACPKEGRQTLLFSATMPPEIEKLSEWAMKTPERIEIGARRSPAETVTHAIYPVAASQKFDLLLALLEETHYHSVIIFVRTKDAADRIASRLEDTKHLVTVMHSNRSQKERQDALEGFRNGKYEVMVATDIASRGIDVSGVTHVINYDVPQHAEDYVHRIGRTGRAEAEGDAFTLMTAEEAPDVAAIERFIGQQIDRKRLENFKYVYSLALDDKNQHKVSRAGNVRGGRAGKGYSFGMRR